MKIPDFRRFYGLAAVALFLSGFLFAQIFQSPRPPLKPAPESMMGLTDLHVTKLEPSPLPAPVIEQAPAPAPAPDVSPPVTSLVEEAPEQLWKKNAVAVTVPEGFSKIVLIIDDIGVDHRHSDEAVALPGPLTLSFLPYAKHLDKQAKNGRDHGHELMIHMPMEPLDPDLDTGPMLLHEGMTPEEFETTLNKALSAFDGYVGLNNHMGSRLTRDRGAMEHLMDILRKRGLLFVDSRTTSNSVAANVAATYGLPHISRDVFLDDDPAPEKIRQSLAHLELVARKRGYAVAIGHPRPHTIKALKEWLPTLKDKKLALVPVSAVVKVTAQRQPDRTFSSADRR